MFPLCPHHTTREEAIRLKTFLKIQVKNLIVPFLFTVHHFRQTNIHKQGLVLTQGVRKDSGMDQH